MNRRSFLQILSIILPSIAVLDAYSYPTTPKQIPPTNPKDILKEITESIVKIGEKYKFEIADIPTLNNFSMEVSNYLNKLYTEGTLEDYVSTCSYHHEKNITYLFCRAKIRVKGQTDVNTITIEVR